jgi:Dullard-like phosphatase family protein
MYSRISYGMSAADSTNRLHSHAAYPAVYNAPSKHAAPAAATRVAYAAAQTGRPSTPVRSTTPIRTSHAATAARPARYAADKRAGSSTGSPSSFMTQAQRGDETPRRQISRPTHATHAYTAPVRRGPTLLPPTPMDQRMLLVLDMDETLLHADVSPVPHDASFIVRMDNGATTPVYVKFRPHLTRFLSVVSRLFEVVVFTASISKYANQVLDYIDPTGEFVHHRLYREHCTDVNGTYVKDLERLGRPLERVSIVDNSPVAYTFHPENAVAIPSWYDCDRDQCLHQLLPHLERMARARHVYEQLDDIRRELRWD